MEIYRGNVKVLNKEINAMFDQLYKKQNKATSRAIFMTIPTLLSFYCQMNGDSKKYIKSFNKYRNFCLKGIENNYINNTKFFDNLLENSDVHSDFFNSIFDYDEEYTLEYRTVKESEVSDIEIYNIITSFLEEKHPEMVDVFDKLIEDKLIFNIDEEIDYDGEYKTESFAVANPILNKNHIIIYGNKNTVSKMIELVHEFGHISDYYMLQNSTDKMKAYTYHDKSIMLEVNSFLYEKQFYNYLLENNLYVDEVRNSITAFYDTLFSDLVNANLLFSLPNELLNKDQYQNLSQDELYEILNSNCEVLVEKEELPNPSNLDLFETVVYSYGRLFGTYFADLEEKDLDKYCESYNKFLLLRADFFKREIFGELGIKKHDIKEIINNDLKVKTNKVMVKNS